MLRVLIAPGSVFASLHETRLWYPCRPVSPFCTQSVHASRLRTSGTRAQGRAEGGAEALLDAPARAAGR